MMELYWVRYGGATISSRNNSGKDIYKLVWVVSSDGEISDK